jgi:hypothetical protein
VDESQDRINREEMLKLGGSSAFAALAALVIRGTAEAAEAKPAPSGLDVPLGLDFSGGGGKRGKRGAPKKTDAGPTPTSHVLVTSNKSQVPAPSANVLVYEMTTAKVSGPVPKGPKDQCDADGHYPKLWVVIWL